MSLVRICDRCGKKLLGDDYKAERSYHNKVVTGGIEIDFCAACDNDFHAWIRKFSKEEEDDTKDIVKAFSDYNKAKMKENNSGLDYPIEKFIEQHADVLFPTDLKPSAKGGLIDYGTMARTRFINKLKKLQINTIKQFLYSFSDRTSFRSFYGASTQAMNRYCVILRILKTEGYYDNFSVGQKKLLEKMDAELKLKRAIYATLAL